MKYFRLSAFIPLLSILSIFMLFACSGGDSSTSGSKVTASAGESGTVALFMKDGPIDYDEIWITVTKVALIPSDDDEGSGDGPVVIFESAEGEEIDLLSYQEEPYLFLVDGDVPAGDYAKIRLWVKDIQPVGEGPCENEYIEVKLPSGKIDLNPQGGFTVVPGEALAIELDVDLEKSINIHEAGNSGKCIFRPVIFVDIYDHPSVMPKCPQIIAGTIEGFLLDSMDAVIGFEMKQANAGDHKKLIKVLTENADIFNENGAFVGPDDLEIGDEVKVRGKLNEEGAVNARMVVVGDVAMVKGVALGAVSQESGVFNLEPKPGQVVTGESLPVFVASETLVLIGCDAETDASVIIEGMEALVIGKYNTDRGLFLAVAVLLRPEKFSGLLTAVDLAPQGSWLTVVTNPESDQPTEMHLFLPSGVLPHIKGDGLIPMKMLESLVDCEDRPVEVVLDTEESYKVIELALIPQQVSGTVEADAGDALLSLYDEESAQTILIEVYAYATIINSEGSLIDVDTIQVGDFVVSHGLESCEDGVDQKAFVLSVQAEAPEVLPE